MDKPVTISVASPEMFQPNQFVTLGHHHWRKNVLARFLSRRGWIVIATFLRQCRWQQDIMRITAIGVERITIERRSARDGREVPIVSR